MSNFDTIRGLVGPGTTRNTINALVLAATTETAFAMGTDTSGTSVPAILSVPLGSTFSGAGNPVEFNQNASILSISYGRKAAVGTELANFSASTFDAGRPFKVRIAGTVTLNAGSGNTLAIKLYQVPAAIVAAGTAATLSNDVAIAALTAGGAPSTTSNFLLETTIQWNLTGATLQGWYMGQSAGTLTAATTLTNAASVPAATGLNFIASATFGNAGGGTVNVSEFSIEQL